VITSYLMDCPPVGKRRLQRSDESRVIIIDNVLLTFTPIEYRLLLMLLNNKQIVSDNDLIREVFECDVSSSVRKCLERHIDKVRTKTRVAGLNVHRVTKLGYVLLDITEFDADE
jgi:DNA-binding response OmpR family regulator